MFKNKDFEYALILGIIIGVFITPLLYNTGLGSKHHFAYAASVIGFPILAILGLAIAKLLFAKFAAIWQFVKFGLIGVSNTAINFGVLNGLVAATGVVKGWPIYLIAAVAFTCALFNSYLWNSHWSFANANKRTTSEFIEFFLVTFIGQQVNSLIIYVITTHVNRPDSISPKLWVNVANVIATLCVMFWNFFGFKLIVFRDRSKELAVQPVNKE